MDAAAAVWSECSPSMTALAVGGAIVLVTVAIFWARASKLKLPPGPGGYPIVGSLPRLGALPGEAPHRTFRRLAQKYGPIVFLQMGSYPTVVISDSTMAKVVLKDQDQVFGSRPHIGKYAGNVNSKGLTFSETGDHYNRLRKIYMSEILSAKRLTETRNAREGVLATLLGAIHDRHSAGKPSNLTELMNNWSILNVLNMISGGKEGRTPRSFSRVTVEDVKLLVHDYLAAISEFNYGDYIPIARRLDLTGVVERTKSLHKRMRFIAEALMADYVEMRASSPVVRDDGDQTLLDVLLSLKEQKTIRGGAITGVILDWLIAGSDTTWITVDWAIAELLRKPEQLERLRAEIDSVVDKGRHVSEVDVQSMPFLQCVVKETLRLHSPSPMGIPHYATQSTRISDYDIPSGTTVIVNFWALNRDPHNWPDAEEFRPERFEDSDTNVFGRDFTLLPFSSGRRGCLGMNLGFTLVQLVLASILHSFDLEPFGMKLSDIDVHGEKAALSLQRAQELIVWARPRLPPHLYNPTF